VLLVEVDRGTTAAKVAEKVERYRRFFRLVVDAHTGRERPVVDDVRGHWPRGRRARRAGCSPDTWGPRSWPRARSLSATSPASTGRAATSGMTTGTEPASATATPLQRRHPGHRHRPLADLQAEGPHAAIWLRYGHQQPETRSSAPPSRRGSTRSQRSAPSVAAADGGGPRPVTGIAPLRGSASPCPATLRAASSSCPLCTISSSTHFPANRVSPLPSRPTKPHGRSRRLLSGQERTCNRLINSPSGTVFGTTSRVPIDGPAAQSLVFPESMSPPPAVEQAQGR
jgi:hypothetical protein